MSLKRFLTGLALGLLVVVGLAWGQQVLFPQPPAPPGGSLAAPALPVTPEVYPQATPALPAATQALVAQQSDLVNPPRQDIRLVVISDLNSAYGSTDYEPEVDRGMALVPFWRPDLVVCSGDMVAGQNPSLSRDRIDAMWQAFDDHIAAPLRQQKIPYGFTLGNHDASSALGVRKQYLFSQERDRAAAYWTHASHNPGLNFLDRSQFPFYYTFTYGGVFFMAWDGSSSHISDQQLAWIDQTLASPAAQTAKARIVISHLPLYAVAVGRDEPGEVLEKSPQIQAMLERHHVHTVISGHHHAYYPAHKGKLQLLHTGILGAGPRPLIDSKLPTRKTITVVDIDFDNADLTTYTTYDMATLKPVANQELPRLLAGHNGMLLRRDVTYESLKPEETSFCQQRLGEDLCRA
ncbi:MAG: metallophosphoesterase [Cyanobacteria bacterium REEB459]|nr:metallophosphoesterase [Cyanobacteria bacterium REEB459]